MTSHIGILPTDVFDALVAKLTEAGTHQNLRFLRLPHPRTGVPSLFLPYAKPDGRTSIMEVQTVAPPNERSWFLSEGQVVQNGELLIMTPVDPAFLLIPILHVLSSPNGHAGTFRPVDDMFEDAVEKLLQSAPSSTEHLCKEDLLRFLSLDCARNAMARTCEKKQITEELTVYRYSPDVVVENLRKKVMRLNSQPMFEASKTLTRALARDGLMDDGKDGILEGKLMGRLRAACDLVSQYVPDHLQKRLLASYDFTTLEEHIKSLNDEAAALAAAEMGKMEIKESKSSATEKTNGKKRKTASTGVEKLKKVNTKGMAKLSTFFQPKAL
ncbi:uncharacterized protein PHACADRAFT_123606 [Phanerochaete carnosa HHB-10118-sp]|uniref:Ribonuclease H2 subunit B n=1 Tax=Phanerochaete carnosa (strain HHB-10118-sp) TaxID=650164 RepID=K5VSM1_PHACS|nr:uncharacterized protein PHACADRAFT_123606 [Phanerochaete carnosa HHB-10118-sp]EKM54493.1 hypothetical protein PHACADRAFT_123606 [Phanerochaete carnosa HHB-10118-sp]